MFCKICEIEKDYTSYYKSNKRICKKCVSLKAMEQQENHPKKARENSNKSSAKWKLNHQVEVNVELQTRRYMKEYKVRRDNCQLCGRTKTENHHPDYSKWYLVVFLCHRCHSSIEDCPEPIDIRSTFI